MTTDALSKCPLCREEVKIYRQLNLGDPEPTHWLVDNLHLQALKLAEHLRDKHGALLPIDRQRYEKENSNERNQALPGSGD